LTRIETISWRPRAYVFHNFLSQEEADHIVTLVESKVGLGLLLV
jgi:prolyl 4-hydroxylase